MNKFDCMYLIARMDTSKIRELINECIDARDMNTSSSKTDVSPLLGGFLKHFTKKELIKYLLAQLNEDEKKQIFTPYDKVNAVNHPVTKTYYSASYEVFEYILEVSKVDLSLVFLSATTVFIPDIDEPYRTVLYGTLDEKFTEIDREEKVKLIKDRREKGYSDEKNDFSLQTNVAPKEEKQYMREVLLPIIERCLMNRIMTEERRLEILQSILDQVETFSDEGKKEFKFMCGDNYASYRAPIIVAAELSTANVFGLLYDYVGNENISSYFHTADTLYCHTRALKYWAKNSSIDAKEKVARLEPGRVKANVNVDNKIKSQAQNEERKAESLQL